jgi:hypothetical protein
MVLSVSKAHIFVIVQRCLRLTEVWIYTYYEGLAASFQMPYFGDGHGMRYH